MNELITIVGAWIADNSTVITISTVFTGALTWLAWYFSKKVVPMFAMKILKYVASIIARLFGVGEDAVLNGVNQLPIIEDLKRNHKEHNEYLEAELVKVKSKLLMSDRLTEAERITAEYLYDKYLAELGDELTEKTKEVLAKLDRKV